MRAPAQRNGTRLIRRVRFEYEDEHGQRGFHILNGPVSREGLMKAMDEL